MYHSHFVASFPVLAQNRDHWEPWSFRDFETPIVEGAWDAGTNFDGSDCNEPTYPAKEVLDRNG